MFKPLRKKITPFVCWSSDMGFRRNRFGIGAKVHIQHPDTGGKTTLCGIDTAGWRFNVHPNFLSVDCKRCLSILARHTAPSPCNHEADV